MSFVLPVCEAASKLTVKFSRRSTFQLNSWRFIYIIFGSQTGGEILSFWACCLAFCTWLTIWNLISLVALGASIAVVSVSTQLPRAEAT